MNKLQHVLIVGDPDEVMSKLPLIVIKTFGFGYCTEDKLRSELLNTSQSYDWVLFDRKSLQSRQMQLPRQSGCQLEWNDQGILQLHCCMHARKRSPTEKLDACIFEYHAPMTKTS